MSYATQSDLAFFIVCVAFLGAFLFVGCVILSFFSIIFMVEKMKKGWTFGEAFKQAMEAWK